MRLATTAARLKTIALFRQNVNGAANYAKAIKGGFKIVPAAFLLPLADRPQPNPFANQIVQHTTFGRVGVVIAVQNLRDPFGAQANEDLEDARDAVFAKLLGWSPGAGMGGFEWVAGALLDLDDQVLFWQDDFTTEYVKRSS